MRKVYESAIVVTGDASGGLKAIKMTGKEIDNLNTKLTTTNKKNTQFRKNFHDTSVSLHGFRSALLSVTTITMAKYFSDSADAMKNIDARLRIVTSGLKEFNFAQSELARISLETHSSIDTTSRLYTRMQQSLKDIHVSQSQLLTVTQSINQAFAVSGATAHEASAAIIQMTQALASGQLRGEEYRSISEQATRILQVLQDELGKTRGELLLMAHSGQLTSEIVINAMLNQAAALDSEFAKLPLTIERSMTDLDNNFKLFVRDLEDATNATGLVALGIKKMSEQFAEIALFIGLGLFAKLATKIFAVGRAAVAYGAAFGVAETATLGLATATATLNKRLSLLGGVWGIALFAGIEFFSWLSSKERDVIAFSDEYDQAMAAVKEATADGFGVEDIGVFKTAITESLNQVKTLRDEIARLSSTTLDLSDLDTPNRILVNAYAGGTGINNDAQIAATTEKYDELEKALEDNINSLKRVDESFGVLDETMIRHTFNVGKLGQVQGSLMSVWNLAKSSLGSLVQEQNKANDSIEKWAEKTQKSIDLLDKQILTFGMSKEEILLYEASLIDSTKGAGSFQKIQTQLSKTLAEKVKILQKLRKEKKKQSDLDKKEKARLKAEESERRKRLETFKKDLAAAVKSVDPLRSMTEAFEEQMLNMNKVLEEGQISMFDYMTGWVAMTEAFEKEKDTLPDMEADFRSLMEEFDRELEIQQAVGDRKLELIAIRELENKKIEATTERIAELVAKYKEELGANGENPFGAGIDGFGDLLSQAFGNVGKEGQGFFATMQAGFGAMGESAQNFAGGLQSVMSFAAGIGEMWDRHNLDGRSNFDVFQAVGSEMAASGAFGPWAQIFGAIEQAIDAISGGKLFGTAFEAESGFSSLSVGSGGASGFLSQTFVRERSWFRGREWETIVSDIAADVQRALEELVDRINVVIENAMQLLQLDEFTGSIDGTFQTDFDAEGNVVREYSQVGGREYDEDQQSFQERLIAENILAVINAALPQVERTFTETFWQSFGFEPELGIEFGQLITEEVTRMVDEADMIAERWRHDASLLLEGSQFLLLASQRIVEGSAIFESLTAAADFVELNARANETLDETYQRVIDSESLFTNALERMGQEFSLLGEEFIQYSVDFVEAAGGIDEARSLVNDYFANFYTEQENTIFRLNSLYDEANSQLGALGLDSSITMDDFQALLESQLNDLAPEDLAAWYAAGNALAELNTEIERLVLAEQAYLDFVNGFREGLLALSGTEYGVQMDQLNQQYLANVESANALAIAAGRSGASVEDLALIQEAYAAQTRALVAELRNHVLDLANQLYGGDLDNMIAELESQQTGSIQTVNDTALNMWQNQLRAVESISQVIDSLLINEELSPLSRTDQFNEAFDQFNELLALAQGGDVDAMNQLPAMAQALLQIARDVFASGGDYTDIFNTVLDGLGSIGVTLSEPAPPQQVEITPSAELQALYLEREERDAALYAQQRLELASQLAVHLAELADFVGQPVLELATELGISMAALITDLGFNLEDLTAQTTAELANVANVLGVELLDLAESLGNDLAESLGSLADSQSLLNDALEEVINGLPEGTAEFLAPFLEAIENATNEADANQAIQDMEDAINTLPVDQANELAAFFDNIDYQSEFDQQLAILDAQRNAVISSEEILGRIIDEDETQTNHLGTIRDHSLAQTNLLTSIDSGIGEVIQALNNSSGNTGNTNNANSAPNLPQFDVGVRKLQSDTVAQLHKGETVLPAHVVDALDKFGIPTQSGGIQQDVVGALQQSVETLVGSQAQITEAIKELKTQVEASTDSGSDKVVSAIESTERSIYR